MTTPADMPRPEDYLPQGRANHLTEEMASAVVGFMCEMAVTMGLPMWQIMVMVEPSEDEAWADIQHTRNKLQAELRLSKSWMTLDHKIQEETLTHELLHLVHYRIDLVIDDLHDRMGISGAMEVRQLYLREVEYMVEHLARLVCTIVDVESMWVKHLKKNKAYVKN